MSIASAIQNAQQKIANAYTAISNKGGTLPATQDLANMPTAINSISTANLTSLSVTPSTTAQALVPSSPYSGFNQVDVSAVTSSIDANITAGNIKKDVQILGVTGTYEGSSGGGTSIPREVVNGVYKPPEYNFTFSLPSNATDIGTYAMYYAFYGCTGLTSIDLSSLTTVSGNSAMNYAFQNCTSLTSVDLSSLTTISGNGGMNSTFYGCTGLTSVDLSSLTTISGISAMSFAFYGCTGLTSVDLSSLTIISGSSAMNYAFRNCTSLTYLSFPALTSTSFGSYTNQFNNMLSGVTGCTVHFPSNLQSVIGSWSSVTSGFGGTNTTVLYDLPATS
jgi:surface protein